MHYYFNAFTVFPDFFLTINGKNLIKIYMLLL